MSGKEAFDIGLVNHVVPDSELEAETDKLASKIAAGSVSVSLSEGLFHEKVSFFVCLGYALRKTSSVLESLSCTFL